MSALQDRKPSVLPEVAIEGDDFGDAEALHNREAQCVTERVGLVLVVTREQGVRLVDAALQYGLNAGQRAMDDATFVLEVVTRVLGTAAEP